MTPGTSTWKAIRAKRIKSEDEPRIRRARKQMLAAMRAEQTKPRSKA
jgi:hypothetical protein